MNKSAPIRVLIVDDHSIIRVKADLELVGEGRNGQDALRLCELLQPDVVLMDLVMPRMDGVEATHAIREQWPQIQIIALTSFKEKEMVHDALQAGAISYLLKDVSVDELAEAIRGAHAGRPTLAPEATQALIQVASQSPALGHDLTPREREVLALMVERLFISVTTVRSHVSSILSKLEVSNRAEAITLALRNKLVT
jgi:NarL family two-component system response regulator LiaR